ncbi:MAG: TolC family protein [Opitutales bacterium]|nr:TolC family protein [Opitutales bacterium]MBT6378659.1 TolC family protein [Opitutales bacterium]
MNSLINRIFHASLLLLAISAITENALADQSDTHPPSPIPIILTGNDIVGPFIAEALERNPGLQAFDLRYQAARESIASSRALPNPRVQLTHFVESIQTRTGPQRQAIQLQQPILWHGKRARMQDASQAQAESLWHAYSAQQFDIVQEISQLVLDIAYLDKAIAFTLEQTRLLQQLNSIVEERVKSGGALNELLRLQVETQRFEDLVANQRTQRFSAAVKLEAILGRQYEEPIIEFEWEAPNDLIQDSSLWLPSVQERNPKIAILRALENSQEARKRIAKLTNKPDFTVGLNYLRTGDALNPSASGSGKDPWALMVGVSLPIWSKANNAIVMQASLQKEAIASQINEQKLLLNSQARTWIARLEDSQQRIQRYETKLLPIARQARDIFESNFRTNKASLLDLFDSERTLIELETQYWRAAADAWVARWKLATLSGGLWLN